MAHGIEIEVANASARGRVEPVVNWREMVPALSESLRALATVERILRHYTFKRKNMGLIRTLIVFGTGFYSGVYVTQNYEIPRVDDPSTLYEKTVKNLNDYLEQYRKDR